MISRLIGNLATTFLFFFILISTSPAGELPRQVVLTENGDYFGFDLRAEQDVTLDQCKAACLKDNQCHAFTYNVDAQWCFLKSDYSRLEPYQGAIAGRVVEAAAEEDIGAPEPLRFVPAYIADEAQKYAAQFENQTGLPPTDSADSGLNSLNAAAGEALVAGSARNAMDLYAAGLLLSTEDSRLWAGLARAVLLIAPEGDERYQLPQIATSSALNAYLVSRSTGSRAQSLALLAEALERRGLSRPALESYKASLALENSVKIRAAYSELKARKGFRVIDHTIDSDSISPRICVQFSEDLIKTGLDYGSYLTVDGTTPAAVDTKGRQICVEGLTHGQRYRIALRAGLPAAIGEALDRPVALNVYVRDRSPAVRFTGNNFVLPSTARRGIPLVSVNSDAASLKLYRVGERALTQLLNQSLFLRQLDGFSADQMSQKMGVAIWKGALEIDSELNQDVTTNIPVDELVPDLQPGIYVLTATPEGIRNSSWDSQATQWFVVSDIGLTSYAGEDGLNIFVRSLADARPLPGVSLRLLARNNELLGTATTDADGRGVFTAGLTRGRDSMAPAILVASSDQGDFVFLDLTRPGFDLSDRGVTGRPASGALDVYAWTERGIYRAGETVHVAALARNGAANAVSNLPLTFVFRRPDGVEERREVSRGAMLGGYAVDLLLQENAMRGTWQVRIHTDPKLPPIAEQMFLVEDFVPDRIEFDLDSTVAILTPGQAGKITVDGRYLYGAPAAGLTLEGEVNLATTRAWRGYEGYEFGLADEDKVSRRLTLGALPLLDADGRARFDVRIDDTPSTTRSLVARVSVRLRESGGRAVERSIDIPVAPVGNMIGIRPEFTDGQVAEGSAAGFQVIMVEPTGERIKADGLRWSLQKIERNYQWYRSGRAWNYEPVIYTSQIADGRLAVATANESRIDVPVDWGRYRLEIGTDDPNGPVSSVEFTAGWFVESASTETPDGLEIALDRESYRPGDTARLTVSPRFAGELLVAIGTDRLHETLTVSVPEQGTTIDIPVGDDWGAGVYVTATLFRPGADQDSRMPMRAIGVKWLQIDPGARSLAVEMAAQPKVDPNGPLEIPIRIAGLRPGEEAYLMVAAVDVGILNLTSYESPNPETWYYGQRRIGFDLRDLYGRLIDSSTGAAGRIRSGGDASGMTSNGSPPTEQLVAYFAGPVKVDETGNADVGFDLPQFNGTVRVMAVAWTAGALGHATADVVVRDPVVVTAGLPKFLAPGDRSRMRLDFANTDGPSGEYTLTVMTEGGVSINSDGAPGALELAQGARQSLYLPLSGDRTGSGSIRVRLAHGENVVTDQTLQIPVRPALMPVTRNQVLTLAPQGGNIILDTDFLAGSMIEGAAISIGVTKGVGLDVPALVMSLDRYPYGCAEQTTSRALPLLYLSEMTAAAGMAEDPTIRERIQKAVDRVLSYQSNSGGFGLWRPGSGDLWLDAYVTDFLTRAREQDFDVPKQAMIQALENLQNNLAYITDLKESGSEIAYATYVLARNRRATAGDLRYYADTRLDAFASPMARAQIGASLALYGDPVRADKAFNSALNLASGEPRLAMARADYGSSLRDKAAMLALAAETRPAPSRMAVMKDLVFAANRRARYHSTQENAWLLLAARALQDGEDIDLKINGGRQTGSYAYVLTGENLAMQPISITNLGQDPLEAAITIAATPQVPLPAGGDGFSISRTYYHLDGRDANITNAEQNERYVVVIRVNESNAWPSRVIVSDLLPAGFEIDNPRLVGSAELSNFGWLGETNAAHVEFRSDRFVAAFDRSASSPRDITMAYVVRAVTPGDYAHPAASVEDMYRPQFSARTATGRMRVSGPRP